MRGATPPEPPPRSLPAPLTRATSTPASHDRRTEAWLALVCSVDTFETWSRTSSNESRGQFTSQVEQPIDRLRRNGAIDHVRRRRPFLFRWIVLTRIFEDDAPAVGRTGSETAGSLSRTPGETWRGAAGRGVPARVGPQADVGNCPCLLSLGLPPSSSSKEANSLDWAADVRSRGSTRPGWLRRRIPFSHASSAFYPRPWQEESEDPLFKLRPECSPARILRRDCRGASSLSRCTWVPAVDRSREPGNLPVWRRG